MRTQKVLYVVETKSDPVDPRTTVEGFARFTSEDGDCARSEERRVGKECLE